MTSTDDYIGTHLGNYLVGARLASGQFGSVYYGKHRFLDRQVAIKFLHEIHLFSSEDRDAFLQEAQLLERLEHPHCLRVYDVGIDHHVPYIISQYAVNGSLWDRMRASSGPLSLAQMLDILTQIGQALQHAHEHRVIHRDLKPANILFDHNHQVLLADFGLAIVLHAASVQPVGVAGTPEYMAPEQFQGEAGKRSDQYALGCIAYELFTGHLPFEASDFASLGEKHNKHTPLPPSHYTSSLPSHIEHAILKTMAKQRTDRYASVADFVEALNERAPHVQKKKALPAASAPESISSPISHLMKLGDDLLQQHRYKEALQAYEQALRLDAQNRAAALGKAQTLTQLTWYEKALVAYEQVIALDHHCLDAYLGKGHVLDRLRRYQDALLTYKEAQRLHPREREIFLRKCAIYLELKRYEPALVAIDRAIQIDPHYAIAYNDKACVYIGLQRYEEAVNTCEQAIQLASDLAVAHHNKGYALYHLQRYEEALQAYHLASHLNPRNINTRVNKTDILIRLQLYEEAIEAADQILQLDPQFARAYLLKGYAFQGLGQYKEALYECNQALLLQADLTAAYICKAEVLENLGRIAEARKARQKAQE